MSATLPTQQPAAGPKSQAIQIFDAAYRAAEHCGADLNAAVTDFAGWAQSSNGQQVLGGIKVALGMMGGDPAVVMASNAIVQGAIAYAATVKGAGQ